MGLILGTNLKHLNDIEIGLLILSAYYHDQGMLIDEASYSGILLTDSFQIFRDNWIIEHPNYSEIKNQIEQTFISTKEKEILQNSLSQLDAAILTDFLRDNHGQFSYDYITKTFENERILTINKVNLATYLGNICLSHSKSYEWILKEDRLHFDENISTFKVNTIFLSVLLRLADILDFDSDRTPDVLFKSIHFTNNLSLIEWQKHRSVKGWEISKELLRFSMQFEHPVYEKTARTFIDWIDKELFEANTLMRNSPLSVKNYKIEIADKVDRGRIGPKHNSYLFHDLEFSLSRDEIVKLLMVDNLYKNPSICIRELLQNSLDALRYRKAIYQMKGLSWESGSVSFQHYLDVDGQEVLECKDNGCGMDENIVINYLGKVGRSFYRSPEFERRRIQLREKGVDFEPCSQFGIGFMSCFMIGDRINIETRKIYNSDQDLGKPLIIEINGLNGLFVLREGAPSQEIGTTVKIFSRQKPIFFDLFSDKIRLITTLNGYALATEFPIEAECKIEEIQRITKIPASIDRKKTFLENLNISKIATYEINLNEVDKNLNGFLRQSFLIDEKDLPSCENDEAIWGIRIEDKKWQDKSDFKTILKLKKTDETVEYNYFKGLDEGLSICVDGILVCGSPCRDSHNKIDRMLLGHFAPKISSEHPSTIDIRGDIKPELSPARTPLDSGGLINQPLGWLYVQKLIDKGRGMLWEKVLKLTNQGLTGATFLKLISIYEGSLFNIHSQKLIKYIQLPTEKDSWIKLSTVNSFYINKAGITLVADDKEFKVNIPKDIFEWGKAHINGTDYISVISNLLVSLSLFNPEINDQYLFLRKDLKEDEVPTERFFQDFLYALRMIPFSGLSEKYITTTKFNNLANSENPLVRIAKESQFLKHKNELQEFSRALVFNLCHLIEDLNNKNKPFSIEIASRPLKHTSILFQKIDWKKYSDDFKPPYRIYIDKDKSIDIDLKEFEYWVKQKIEIL